VGKKGVWKIMKGYYTENYVTRMYRRIELEWNLFGAENAYVRFIKGEISIYQARALIYSAILEDGVECKAKGSAHILCHDNPYFYNKYYYFDYEKLMKEGSNWLKKTI
jgi:hypothetical protein